MAFWRTADHSCRLRLLGVINARGLDSKFGKRDLILNLILEFVRFGAGRWRLLNLIRLLMSLPSSAFLPSRRLNSIAVCIGGPAGIPGVWIV